MCLLLSEYNLAEHEVNLVKRIFTSQQKTASNMRERERELANERQQQKEKLPLRVEEESDKQIYSMF